MFQCLLLLYRILDSLVSALPNRQFERNSFMVRFAARMLFFFVFGLLAAWPASANSPWAWRPVVIDGGPTGIASAYSLDDIAQASIGYHHANASAPQLWFRFDGKYGDKVHVQIGVPQLQQYRLLRPIVAIVGPGMPAPPDPLPFALPAGYGALIYDTAAESVENYKESFTGTESWRFSAEDFHLPASGPTYIVGFTPNGEEGKFWMAVGEKRSFRFADLFTINETTRKIRAFFEVNETAGVVFWSQVLAGFLAVFLAVFAVSPR
jgi:hypothetical protein